MPKRLRTLVLVVVYSLVGLARAAGAAEPADDAAKAKAAELTRKAMAKGFPAAGIDVVHHQLKVDMLRLVPRPGGRLPDRCQEPEDVGATAELVETIVFEGRMVLERTTPTLDQQERALSNFQVVAWQAAGYSSKLETEIQYILSQDQEQPMGEIRAQRAKSGLPADFVFDLTFDVRANNRTIIKGHHGMPKGHGFLSIPPDGRSPQIREFEACYVQLEHPELGMVRFVPRECNDKSGKTLSRLPPSRAKATVDLAGVREDITKKPVR